LGSGRKTGDRYGSDFELKRAATARTDYAYLRSDR
jgi:hypothetical protein